MDGRLIKTNSSAFSAWIRARNSSNLCKKRRRCVSVLFSTRKLHIKTNKQKIFCIKYGTHTHRQWVPECIGNVRLSCRWNNGVKLAKNCAVCWIRNRNQRALTRISIARWCIIACVRIVTSSFYEHCFLLLSLFTSQFILFIVLWLIGGSLSI